MVRRLILRGVCYGAETWEDMDRRERLMAENNARADALQADWERQRSAPMAGMREWAAARGII